MESQIKAGVTVPQHERSSCWMSTGSATIKHSLESWGGFNADNFFCSSKQTKTLENSNLPLLVLRSHLGSLQKEKVGHELQSHPEFWAVQHTCSMSPGGSVGANPVTLRTVRHLYRFQTRQQTAAPFT